MIWGGGAIEAAKMGKENGICDTPSLLVDGTHAHNTIIIKERERAGA